MIVFIIKVDNFNFTLIDPKNHSPVARDEQTPGAFAVSGQLMRLPTRDGPQIIHILHVLEKRYHAPHLGYDSRLETAGIVIHDEAPEPFVDDVSDFHEAM
jgi:hypothetical protein